VVKEVALEHIFFGKLERILTMVYVESRNQITMFNIFFGFTLSHRRSTIVPYHSSLKTEVCNSPKQAVRYDAIYLNVIFISDPALLYSPNKSPS
jgi:hypothetical protein